MINHRDVSRHVRGYFVRLQFRAVHNAAIQHFRVTDKINLIFDDGFGVPLRRNIRESLSMSYFAGTIGGRDD